MPKKHYTFSKMKVILNGEVVHIAPTVSCEVQISREGIAEGIIVSLATIPHEVRGDDYLLLENDEAIIKDCFIDNGEYHPTKYWKNVSLLALDLTFKKEEK